MPTVRAAGQESTRCRRKHTTHEPAALQAEARLFNDTVVVRGKDTYRNFPNKTLRLLRYTLAHPKGEPALR